MPASYIFTIGEDITDGQRRQNEMVNEIVTFLRSEVMWHRNEHESCVQVTHKFFQPLRHILGKSILKVITLHNNLNAKPPWTNTTNASISKVKLILDCQN